MWSYSARSVQRRSKLHPWNWNNLARSSSLQNALSPSCHRPLSSTTPSSEDDSFQSLLQSRRTGISFVHTHKDRQTKEEEELIQAAIHRAVSCAQMAPNHKRTEPFSFFQILHSSSACQDIAEIAFQVAAKTKSVPVATKKKEKWSKIPAYLVTLVHENQPPAVDLQDHPPFEALPFVPPETERQLEDYASACAAIQNILLSLHADGIATKWATGPVIATPAFRRLLPTTQPTDRVAALIMIGGVDSTKFANDREEQITKARRQRKRDIRGDLLQTLT